MGDSEAPESGPSSGSIAIPLSATADAGVAEVVANDRDVDASLKERDRAAVAEDVGCHAQARERRNLADCQGDVLVDEVGDPVASKWSTPGVAENASKLRIAEALGNPGFDFDGGQAGSHRPTGDSSPTRSANRRGSKARLAGEPVHEP